MCNSMCYLLFLEIYLSKICFNTNNCIRSQWPNWPKNSQKSLIMCNISQPTEKFYTLMGSFKTFTHIPLGSLTAAQITSPANKEWTLNRSVLSRRITVQRMWNRKINLPNFFRSSTTPGNHRSCLLLPSVACRAAFWRHVGHAVYLELSPDSPLSFSASLSSFIESMLPAKKLNCFCHIIMDPFYSHVQIRILLCVYMPSNWNYEKRWGELNMSATMEEWNTFCAAKPLFISFSIPPCAAVDITSFWQFLLCMLTTSMHLLKRYIISANNPPQSGMGAGFKMRLRELKISLDRE